jgi:hypothetical protein
MIYLATPITGWGYTVSDNRVISEYSTTCSGYIRRGLWPNLKRYLSSCLEWLRKIMYISEYNWTPVWDFESWIFRTRRRIVPRSTLPCGGVMLLQIVRDFNFGVMVGDWNCLKYFVGFLYCNHLVHRELLITLYFVCLGWICFVRPFKHTGPD